MNQITFIIPCYKAGDTMRRTLDSICGQSDADWKAIIINDGSPDRETDTIACEYAERDPGRISYVKQENLGLGGARNTGLREVETAYVMFLDADDWLMPEFVERFHEEIGKAKVQPDLIYTLPQVWDEVTGGLSPFMDADLFAKIFPVSGSMVCPKKKREIFQLEVNASRKIYRRQFLTETGFSFAEHTKWEDIIPHFELLHRAKYCIGLPDIGFYYRVGSEVQITAGGGADRFQILPIFEKLWQMTETRETLYLRYPVLRVMVRFSFWSVRVADTDVRGRLVEQLHEFFSRIPGKAIRAFYGQAFRQMSKRDAFQYLLFMYAIRRRHLCFLLNDYIWEELAEKTVKKVLRSKGRVA